MTDGLVTELFRFTTVADPCTVWRKLTSRTPISQYLHGLSLESDWQTGSPVTARGTGPSLVGEVLAAVEPRRLSYTLAVDDDHPETFVTWEIHDGHGDTGAIVRLYVDEPDGTRSTRAAWMPVISALQAVLGELVRTR